jgi:hypothetical protein
MSDEPNPDELRRWVEETYTPEGQDDWWAAWEKADEKKRRRMWVGLASSL